MRRGRLPKIGSKRHAAGEYAGRRLGADEVGTAEPPDLIAGDSRAMQFWDKHAPQLIRDGRLRPSGADAFGVVCQLHALVTKTTAAMAKVPLTVRGARGCLTPHPLAAMARQARRDFMEAARDFGMSAAALARMPEARKDDELSADEVLLKKFLA